MVFLHLEAIKQKRILLHILLKYVLLNEAFTVATGSYHNLFGLVTAISLSSCKKFETFVFQ